MGIRGTMGHVVIQHQDYLAHIKMLQTYDNLKGGISGLGEYIRPSSERDCDAT